MSQLLRASDYSLWEPFEVRVDAPKACLSLRRGEVLIETLSSVEDTKGNSGERGQLTLTNLRLLWTAHKNPAWNMSVGWECLAPGKSGLFVRTAQSRSRGNLQALFVVCAFAGAKFEFIFTSLVKASPRLFVTAESVFR